MQAHILYGLYPCTVALPNFQTILSQEAFLRLTEYIKSWNLFTCIQYKSSHFDKVSCNKYTSVAQEETHSRYKFIYLFWCLLGNTVSHIKQCNKKLTPYLWGTDTELWSCSIRHSVALTTIVYKTLCPETRPTGSKVKYQLPEQTQIHTHYSSY